MRPSRHTGSRTLAGLGLGLLTCLLAGCGGGGLSVAGPGQDSTARHTPALGIPAPGTAAPGPQDASLSGMHACSLVSASIVARVLGPLLDKPYETQDGLDCFYETAVPGGGGPTYILSITTRSAYEAAKAFAEGVAQSKAGLLAAAPGLGDDAFSMSTDTGAPDYSLWAVKAGVGLEVNVNDLGKGVANAHDLTAAALGRL